MEEGLGKGTSRWALTSMHAYVELVHKKAYTVLAYMLKLRYVELLDKNYKYFSNTVC